MANRCGNNAESGRLYFGGLQNHCRGETKRRLLPGSKVMTNLDSILKSRDITLPTKVRLVKAMVFPEVMYGFESWTIKKAECWRIDAFELWCWRRLLWVPWTARRSNQSILKETSSEYSLEGLMLSWNSNTLATWCEEVTHLKRPWCWERLRVGREGDDRGWDGWMASPNQWTWVWVNSRSWWWTGRPGMLQSMGSQRVRHDWTTELNWLVYDQKTSTWSETSALSLYFHVFIGLCMFPIQLFGGFPVASDSKESAPNVGDSGSIPGSGTPLWSREWRPTPVILAWRIPWAEELGGLQSMGCKGLDMTEQLTLSLSLYSIFITLYYNYISTFFLTRF